MLRTARVERTPEAAELRANVAAARHRLEQAARGVPVEFTSPGIERLTDDERAAMAAQVNAIALAVAQRVHDAASREIAMHGLMRMQAEIERDVARADAAKGKPG